jgi:hypothetical protein
MKSHLRIVTPTTEKRTVDAKGGRLPNDQNSFVFARFCVANFWIVALQVRDLPWPVIRHRYFPSLHFPRTSPRLERHFLSLIR